jgi:predicted phage gp36 major capsid-like protein
MARELFVYWRVAQADAGLAEAALARMQQTLCRQHPVLVARLYRRADAETTTLMETYATPAGVDAALQTAIAAAAERDLAAWRGAVRHVELFDLIGT